MIAEYPDMAPSNWRHFVPCHDAAVPIVAAASSSTVDVGKAVPDGPVILGVRPEDLVLGHDGAPLGGVTVDVVEHLGHETMAHFSLSGEQHVARLSAEIAVSPGQRLPLAITPGGIHLFSSVDGRRLN